MRSATQRRGLNVGIQKLKLLRRDCFGWSLSKMLEIVGFVAMRSCLLIGESHFS